MLNNLQSRNTKELPQEMKGYLHKKFKTVILFSVVKVGMPLEPAFALPFCP